MLGEHRAIRKFTIRSESGLFIEACYCTVGERGCQCLITERVAVVPMKCPVSDLSSRLVRMFPFKTSI